MDVKLFELIRRSIAGLLELLLVIFAIIDIVVSYGNKFPAYIFGYNEAIVLLCMIIIPFILGILFTYKYTGEKK